MAGSRISLSWEDFCGLKAGFDCHVRYMAKLPKDIVDQNYVEELKAFSLKMKDRAAKFTGKPVPCIWEDSD